MNPINGMIIGAAKSGTSSLLRYLAQHPDICTHAQGEMNYFVLDQEYQVGYSAAARLYFGQCPSEDYILAKSAGLLYRRESVLRLHAHNPEVQLIILLRHPVERMYSSFWFEKRKGRERAASFEEALATNQYRVKSGWGQEKTCVYREESCYIDYLPVVYDLFNKEQVHIYLLEDLKENAVRVCQELYKAFGVGAEFTPEIERRHNSVGRPRSELMARMMVTPSLGKKIMRGILPPTIRWRVKKQLASKNETTFSPPPMKSDTRQELLTYFDPYNRQLAELLQRDLNGWGN